MYKDYHQAQQQELVENFYDFMMRDWEGARAMLASYHKEDLDGKLSIELNTFNAMINLYEETKKQVEYWEHDEFVTQQYAHRS